MQTWLYFQRSAPSRELQNTSVRVDYQIWNATITYSTEHRQTTNSAKPHVNNNLGRLRNQMQLHNCDIITLSVRPGVLNFNGL